MKIQILKTGLLAFMALAPTVAFARVRNLEDLIGLALYYIGRIVPLIFALAVLAFLWGVLKYIFKPEKKSEAASFIFFAVIALFVMVSVWGLVRILTGTLGFQFGIPIIRSGAPSGGYIQNERGLNRQGEGSINTNERGLNK